MPEDNLDRLAQEVKERGAHRSDALARALAVDSVHGDMDAYLAAADNFEVILGPS